MWKRVVAISVAIVLLFGGTAWAWRHFRYNYHLKKIQALQAEFGSDMTEEQRRELREKMRAEMDQLSPEQRREAMRPMFQRRQADEQKHLDDYFAMNAEQKAAAIAKDAAAEQERRQRFEARRQQRDGAGQNGTSPGGPGSGGSGGPGGDGPSTQSGDPPPPPAQSDGRANWRNMSPTQRRNQMLNSTTPEQRAQRAAYRQDMAAQRAEMGLPPRPQRPPRW
jgi:hypothetical protein